MVASSARLFAQTSPAIERELEFVRKLASDLGFISLAKDQVEALQKEYRDTDAAKSVRQLGIDVSLLGARVDSRPEERRRLFREAVEASKEFITAYGNEPVGDQARRTLLEASFDYGQFLIEELEIAAQEAPDKLPELRENAGSVFRDGIDAAKQVRDKLRSKRNEDGSPAQRDFYVAWLYQAMLQREAARVADAADRKTLVDVARETFEELILDVGEETLLGQRAWFEMAKSNEVLGDMESAVSDYKDTLATIHNALDSEEIELPAEIRESMFNLAQECYDRSAETLFNLGRIDEALAICQQFRTDLEKYGEQGADPFDVAHPRFGHPVFLTEARAMAESGKPELVAKALEQVALVNSKHPSDIIGVRAKNALRDILEGGSAVNGSLLFEVAKGAYQEREYERAARGLKRAYAAMDDAEKRTLGLESWQLMSRAYALQKRYLESVRAAMRGLELHGKDDKERAADVCDDLERAWNLFTRDAKEMTPALTEVGGQILDRYVPEFGGPGGEAKGLYKEANRLITEAKFPEAAAALARIPVGTPFYEPAQSLLPQIWQRAGEIAKARAAIKDYLAWIETPAAKLDSRELQTTRESAVAKVVFWSSYIDYLEATGSTGKPADPTRFDAIIADLNRFIEERGKREEELAASGYDMMARMQAQTGRISKAEENYRTLRTLNPKSSLLPGLSTAIFKAHWDNVKAIEEEEKALVAKGADPKAFEPIAQRLQTARRAALAMVLDYNETATSPAFDVLYSGIVLAKSLSDWKSLEKLGRRGIEVFGEDPKEKSNVENWVLPAVGEALMRQGDKFEDAVRFLTAADEARKDRPNYPVKRLLSLAQGGWFQFDARGNTQEVLGMDDPIPAYERYWVEYRRYALNPNRGVEDYSLEWYEFHLEAFMLAKRASRKDSKFVAYANTIYNTAKTILDDFARLKSYGPEGMRIYNLFQAVYSQR
jgi:hypothetical protein